MYDQATVKSLMSIASETSEVSSMNTLDQLGKKDSLGTATFNVDEESSVRLNPVVLFSSRNVTAGAEAVPIKIDRKKNVITKTDIEKVLDLKFVSSKATPNFYRVKSNIDEMKLSFHNLGAFQAYERARLQRIKDKAKRKYSVLSYSSDTVNPNDRESPRLTGLKNILGEDKIENYNCHQETKSCYVMRKTRRLAEYLISNIEEIKFLAGGPCDLCGRDSCDGFNHFPEQHPLEKVTQVNNSDIEVVTERPDQSFSFDPVEKDSDREAETMRIQLDIINNIVDALMDAASVESSLKDDLVTSIPSEDHVEYPSVFTIHFKEITLTYDGLETLEFSTRLCKGFKLNYTFLMYKESIEFETEVQGVNIDIKQTRVHRFSMNPIIYQYLLNCCLHIELHDIPENSKRKSKLLGNCDICFKDILCAAHETHTMKLLISDRDRIAFITNGKITDFGNLSIAVSLEVDADYLKSLAKTVNIKRSWFDAMGTGSYTEFMEHDGSTQSLTRSKLKIFSDPRFKLLMYDSNARELSQASFLQSAQDKVTDGEHKAFYDALQLVLVRNKALRTRQSEIDVELNDRAEWMHEELKWRLTLQEHAILSGKDPESVRWRQWRDENTSDVRFRTIMDEEIEYEQVIVITVQHLELLPISQVMMDESIKLIYIEYAFLTHSGLELETKSLPKNAEGVIVYDFVKKFDITMNKDNIDTQVLAEHIRTNQNIKFTAVHEPIEDPEALQTCTALGWCEINLFNLAQHVSNTHEEVYPLKNTKTGAQDVGHLKLRFDGVRAMRTIALTLLAPSAFKIYR